MSNTIDTKLSNLNIWEGTQAQIDGASAAIGANDLVFITDSAFEEKFRYADDMPSPSIDYVGKIVQYVGVTNSSYTQGAFYKCVAIEPHIDTISSGIGLTLSFIASTGIDTFESFCEDNDSDCAYMEITGFNSPYSPTKCVVMSYNASGTTGSYTNSGANFTEIIPEMGLAYSNDGRIGTSDKFRIYRMSYRWDLIEPANTVGFSDITGNPRDNSALDEELDRIELANAIQVTELPEITEDTKDRIYQYVGEEDVDNNLFTGSFYKAFGSTYELDTEHSQYIDDMSFIVNNESQFLQIINSMYSSYPALSDQSYIDIVFYGSGDGSNGYGNAWWIDQSVRPTIYNSWNENYSDLYGGIKFGGQPTINGGDTNPNTTDNTYFHILISKPNEDYQYWNWYPISTYPYQHITSSQVLVNKSRYDTSIIDKKSGDNMNSDGPNNTVIGVNANGSSGGNCTVYGQGAHTSASVATAIGCRAHAQSQGSTAIGEAANALGFFAMGIGPMARTDGQYTLALGYNAYAHDTTTTKSACGVAIGMSAEVSNAYGVALGPSALASAGYSIAIGKSAQATGPNTIAIGQVACATGNMSIQLGNGSNDEDNTLKYRQYKLVDSDGTIPYQRLATNTPQDDYCLVYDSGTLYWRSVTPVIPVTQESLMPAATSEGRTVQYVGSGDGTYVEGYFYKETYDNDSDYWYWRRLNTQPTAGDISYNDISDKPSINGVTLEGDLDPVEDLGLASVASTGSYSDLSTKPGINGHTLNGNVSASALGISNSDLVDNPDTVDTVNDSTLQFWTGTQASYDLITTKDPNTLYIILPSA